MTLGLRFTDGTTTVTVSDGTTGYVTGYRPGSAPAEAEQVTDRARALFLGGREAIRTNVQALNRLFRQAARRQTEKKGPRVFAERDLGDGVWWRSELTEGAPLPEMDIGLAAGKIEHELIYSRKNWWEGAETSVSLSNGHGSGTGGVTVYSHDDAGHDNYLQIAAASISGDLPSPVRLELTNTYASASQLGAVWIGHGFDLDVSAFGHILEAESGTGGSTVSDAGASGSPSGAYKNISLVSGAEATLIDWALSSSLVSAAKGSPVKVLAKFFNTNNITSTRFRAKLLWGGVELWQSGQVMPDANFLRLIWELFTFRLPPWLPDQSSLDGLTFRLTGKQTTGSPITLALDFIELAPADGWRRLEPVGGYVEQNARLVLDEINGEIYRDDGAGAAKVRTHRAYGEPLMLQPGRLQRFYFLMHAITGGVAEIGRTLSVKAFYRPRRLTL